jgi:hypothetical protein
VAVDPVGKPLSSIKDADMGPGLLQDDNMDATMSKKREHSGHPVDAEKRTKTEKLGQDGDGNDHFLEPIEPNKDNDDADPPVSSTDPERPSPCPQVIVQALINDLKEARESLRTQELEDLDLMEDRLESDFQSDTEDSLLMDEIEHFLLALPTCERLTNFFTSQEQDCPCPCSAKIKDWHKVREDNVCQTTKSFRTPHALMDHIRSNWNSGEEFHYYLKRYVEKVFP